MLEGRDTMCVAPTGSGKTLAYVLPTLVKLGDPARNLRGKQEGSGVRGVVIVPTHDLAVQIHAVVKAVTRGRAWRCLLLTKATEKAVCESSPGATLPRTDEEDEIALEAPVEDGQPDEDETEEEDGDGKAQEGSTLGTASSTPPLGIDILVATPERLHFLVDSGQLSLTS